LRAGASSEVPGTLEGMGSPIKRPLSRGNTSPAKGKVAGQEIFESQCPRQGIHHKSASGIGAQDMAMFKFHFFIRIIKISNGL